MRIFGLRIEREKRTFIGSYSNAILDLQERVRALEHNHRVTVKNEKVSAAEQTEIERILSAQGNTSKPTDLWGTLLEV